MDQEAEPSGSAETRRFYDEIGWTEQDGRTVDLELFGTAEDGPIRVELHREFLRRIAASFDAVDQPMSLLECGCGGSPQVSLLRFCSAYTGVDFSTTGLGAARTRLDEFAAAEGLDVSATFEEADVCDLPFEDDRFDAVYSSNMIFHIPDRAAQARAVDEMLRVVRPGGVVVLITSNPFPLLFPGRFLKRVVALTPIVGALARRLRPEPPLPYEPMSALWFRRRIGDRGKVSLISAGLPSTAFNQRVSERGGLGRLAWKGVRWIELTAPRAAVWLGNYTQIRIQVAPKP